MLQVESIESRVFCTKFAVCFVKHFSKQDLSSSLLDAAFSLTRNRDRVKIIGFLRDGWTERRTGATFNFCKCILLNCTLYKYAPRFYYSRFMSLETRLRDVLNSAENQSKI